MLLIDASPIQEGLPDVSMMEQSDTKHLHTCQICFEEVEQQIIATKICGSTCRASICFGCIEEFIRVRVQSIPVGVIAKLDCPICIRPVNLMRWKVICVQAEYLVKSFANTVAASCNILCPNCHSTCNVLPDPLSHDLIEPLHMTGNLIKHLPQLREMRRRFCRHEISLDTLCQFVRDTFPDHYTQVTRRLVQCIKDTERRASLFLRLTREQPFIQSTCCKAAICFTCTTRDHHHGSPCESMLVTKEDIAVCPSCNLTLVKGDGCDWVNCFCGLGFSWTDRVRVHRWSQIPQHRIDLLTAVIRRFTWLRRLRKKVLPTLVRKVNIPKFKEQYVVVREYLRRMVHRKRVKQFVLPAFVTLVNIRRLTAPFLVVFKYLKDTVRRTRFKQQVLPAFMSRVVLMNVVKHKQSFMLVSEYLLHQVWRNWFVDRVLSSKEFHDAIVQYRSRHCVTMMNALPWLKARMRATASVLIREKVVFRKSVVLDRMMYLLAPQVKWMEMTDEERAVVESEEQNYFCSMFDMGDD
ncbi:hypothetical protein AC1031_003743 [Aphanomyces cochlioides]|nr:hypothetical protein AC1031_003743 [Aphanomyces cochlioides]